MRAALILLTTTLAVRALLPLGYMPGNLQDGTFAELCPVASAATYQLLGTAAEHKHDHGNDAADSYSVGSACPIGNSLFFDAIPSFLAQTKTLQQKHVLPEASITQSAAVAALRNYPARAPPLS